MSKDLIVSTYINKSASQSIQIGTKEIMTFGVVLLSIVTVILWRVGHDNVLLSALSIGCIISSIGWMHMKALQHMAPRLTLAAGGAAMTAVMLSVVSLLHAMIRWQWLSINDIILFDLSSLVCVVVLLTAVWAVHVGYYRFFKYIHEYSLNEKLVTYLCISAVVVSLTYTTPQASLITATICAIYFLLLDQFCEYKRIDILWLIVWTIILGSFLAFCIFGAQRNIFPQQHIPMINAFSLFSLIFVISGLLYIPLAYANSRVEILPSEWRFRFENNSQLRNRVQLSILFTLLFSFVAIGVVSIYQIRMIAPDGAGENIQSVFTQALLNTYVFLFLIGLVISMRLSEYIRTPLITLGKKLKAVHLVKENKQIQWEGSDEIADLINEYNQMITKLQDNAALLAQSERDTAWREMSKQVAHEIKNPLTPMKLSLQHLQRSIQYGRDDIEEITLRMCDTLMNQVENLRQIADEFSNFGSLPKANNKKVQLNEIVETIHDLFRKREDMDIRLIEPIDDINVYADKNQLVRILNNLVKNSVQAIPPERMGLIELKLWKEGTNAIIRVRDNGSGIPEDMQSQIFKPKFTTKSSGSGLGLAIAANMVDSIGGRIYFQSDVTKGTDFFVELPLVRDHFDEGSDRVML